MNKLNLAIIGHANAGKTSFLRTLTRNDGFGIVSDKPGSTRHVEKISLFIDYKQSVVFYDTPGLEDSIALYDYISTIIAPNLRLDGIDRLERFLASPEAQLRFNQEAKVIRQLLHSDAGLYVVDVTEPVLEKYHDELAILAGSNKPLLAILNFTASPVSQEQAWRELLSRVGIHSMIRFDAVLPPIDGEAQLYQSLSLLIEPAKILISNLQQRLLQQRQHRYAEANKIIAEALVNVTAYVNWVDYQHERDIEQLQNKIRQYEHKTIKRLLQLYHFEENEHSLAELPVLQGYLDTDLFNAEAMKLMGIRLSKGIVSGALVGVGIDLAIGGMTLGTATLIGATIGGLSQTVKYYKQKVINQFSGRIALRVDKPVICFMALRLQLLRDQLNIRGHANRARLNITEPERNKWLLGKLPKPLQVASVHPEWSILNHKVKLHDEQRQRFIAHLADTLSTNDDSETDAIQ